MNRPDMSQPNGWHFIWWGILILLYEVRDAFLYAWWDSYSVFTEDCQHPAKYHRNEVFRIRCMVCGRSTTFRELRMEQTAPPHHWWRKAYWWKDEESRHVTNFVVPAPPNALGMDYIVVQRLIK